MSFLNRILDLDKQATQGPWEDDLQPFLSVWSGADDAGYQSLVCEVKNQADSYLISLYRSAAPLMAQVIKEVLEVHPMKLKSETFEGGHLHIGFHCEACDQAYPCETVKPIMVLKEGCGW